MKHFIVLFILLLSISELTGSEVIKFTLSDGETIDGMLNMPSDKGKVKMLVVFVHGTGPNTYLNKRKFGEYDFNYFDLFAEELNKRGIAFFTYNRRGVTIGDKPPYFDSVDSVKYLKYLPLTEAEDIETMITELRKRRELRKSKIGLLGASEGTILATMVTDRKKVKIDDLFLFGYANDNLFDIIKWQFSGVSSMMNLKKYFDTDGDYKITKTEYESPDTGAVLGRTKVLQNSKFEQLDIIKDSIIDAKDFAARTTPFYNYLLQMTEAGNDSWIWKNYFRVTSAWLKAHFSLEPNKTRLLRIDIPVFIIHGTDDANVPVGGVTDIQTKFREIGKTNLQCTIVEGHNHDLNYQDWIYKKQISKGLQLLFDTIGQQIEKK